MTQPIHDAQLQRRSCKPISGAICIVQCALLLLAASVAGACTPTVKVATDEPITINLNVNIKHEILVKVDKDLDDLFSDDSELF